MHLKYTSKPSRHYHRTATDLLLPSSCYRHAPTIPMLPSCRYCHDITIQTLPSIICYQSAATVLLLLILPIPSLHFHPTTVLTLPSGCYRIMPLTYMIKPSCHYHPTAPFLLLTSCSYCPAPTIPMLPSRRSCRDNTIRRLLSIMPLKYINKLSCHYDPTATVLLLPSRCHCLAPTIPTLPFCRYSPAITVQTLQLIMPFSSRVDCHVFLPAVNINRH